MFMTADATATATATADAANAADATANDFSYHNELIEMYRIAVAIGPLYPGLPSGCPDDCQMCDEWHYCPHYTL